ncbi:hypothetical protein PoB_002285100 [Plakobranchus ocellatus]|uniref:Uncharacterized protein n=1 Tax=Plakobranchus ocellatus TaxID=259542 RepID=A0AAV3ZK70_9GAST|nr:hypothetical protein PoB_002285100 [Plakobranchus ocellatus]
MESKTEAVSSRCVPPEDERSSSKQSNLRAARSSPDSGISSSMSRYGVTGKSWFQSSRAPRPPTGHIARDLSGTPWLSRSYTPSKGCGTSTGIDHALFGENDQPVGHNGSVLTSRFGRKEWSRECVDK